MIKNSGWIKAVNSLKVFIVLASISGVFGGVGPAAASQEYICVVIDTPDDVVFEQGSGGMDCEEDPEVLSCSIAGDEIACDSSKADCETHVLEDRDFASVQCGEPLNVICVVSGIGSECENHPAQDIPKVDTKEPNIRDEDATIQDTDCVGKWSKGKRSQSRGGRSPVSPNGPMPAGTEVFRGGFWITPLLQKIEGEATSSDYPYTPGTVSGLSNEFEEDSDEPDPTAPILSFAAGPAIEVLVANFAHEKQPEFPTVLWHIECHGDYTMKAQCSGSSSLEERQCALVTRSKDVGGYRDLPGAACNYNYFDVPDQRFVSSCIVEHSEHVDARPEAETPDRGIFSDHHRKLPIKSQVCWDKPAWVMNRILNDPGNAAHSIESRQDHDNLEKLPQEAPRACDDRVRIQWEPLVWEEQAPHSCNHSYKHTYRYDPNTGILEKETKVTVTG